MAKLIATIRHFLNFICAVDCAKCLTDSALLCVESQTFVQDAVQMKF